MKTSAEETASICWFVLDGSDERCNLAPPQQRGLCEPCKVFAQRRGWWFDEGAAAKEGA